MRLLNLNKLRPDYDERKIERLVQKFHRKLATLPTKDGVLELKGEDINRHSYLLDHVVSNFYLIFNELEELQRRVNRAIEIQRAKGTAKMPERDRMSLQEILKGISYDSKDFYESLWAEYDALTHVALGKRKDRNFRTRRSLGIRLIHSEFYVENKGTEKKPLYCALSKSRIRARILIYISLRHKYGSPTALRKQFIRVLGKKVGVSESTITLEQSILQNQRVK